MADLQNKNYLHVDNLYYRRKEALQEALEQRPDISDIADLGYIDDSGMAPVLQPTALRLYMRLTERKTRYDLVLAGIIPKTMSKFVRHDECLISGLIRETKLEWIVSMDIIHLLLLFCTIGDIFDTDSTNKRLKIINTDSNDNKYGTTYQTIETFGQVYNLLSDYSSQKKTPRTILHAFGKKQVSRGVKYKWNLSATANQLNRSMYVGIVDSTYVKNIHQKESKYIPELTKKDYFFSTKYHGYGLCVISGDIFHNNCKYGKPYIMNKITKNNNIITIELDLTGKIYGSLKYIITKLNCSDGITQYWNDICFAYDDILVHRKYQLAVAMGQMVSLTLFNLL